MTVTIAVGASQYVTGVCVGGGWEQDSGIHVYDNVIGTGVFTNGRGVVMYKSCDSDGIGSG